jgi:hypothetical protein
MKKDKNKKPVSKSLSKSIPNLSMEEQDLQFYFGEAEYQSGLQSNYCAMIQKMSPYLNISKNPKKHDILRFQTEYNQSEFAASRNRLIHSTFTKLSINNQRILELYFEPNQMVDKFGFGIKLVPFTKIGKRLYKSKEPYNKYLDQLKQEVDQIYRIALNEYIDLSMEA